MLSPNVGRPSHPVDVPRPIRNTPVPLPWFSPSGSVVARTRETYASFCIMTRGASPLLRWAFFRGLAPILFRPADPGVRARIIAITMNSRSYYASVAPPPKWRLGASYRARRTHFSSAPLFIVAPALPACRATLYRSTINVENGGGRRWG